jgi:alkylation response protein AidB-like acyl-CoA dehydrogenase
VRGRWLPRLLAGELPGIAITEPHGGSQVHATTTAAIAHRDGTWSLTGTKTWISRLTEAAVFVVIFKDPAGQLTAGVVDGTADGLHRRMVIPAGLSGWAWGELHLRNVRLHPSEVLGRSGQGMAILREHFAHYRPLVAATALGVAAAAHDLVAGQLRARRAAGVISGLRDNALIMLGRGYGQINAALLAALTAQRLSDSSDRRAQTWGCVIKAHAADTACITTAELAPLTGASGFAANSPLVKAQHDLRALLYADGIQDSLYRAAGRALIAADQPGHACNGSPAAPSEPRTQSLRPLTQLAAVPFSSDATIPAATASRHAAIRRATSGVTRPAISAASTKANPASSPSASVMPSMSAADRTPPS